MKLMINIPDEAYELLKSKSELDNIAESIIANGTPILTEGDLISLGEAKKLGATRLAKRNENGQLEAIISLDNAPKVETDIEVVAKDAYKQGYTDGWKERFGEPNERPQAEWIPIKYRPLTVDERISLAEHCGIEYSDTLDEKAFDCPMPEDGQHILLSRSWGVDIDVADNDIDGEGFICYGLEGNGDWDGVIAWRPLPEPYKEGGAE